MNLVNYFGLSSCLDQIGEDKARSSIRWCSLFQIITEVKLVVRSGSYN
jgi:hypothetical protein